MNNRLGPILLDVEGFTLTLEDKEILMHPNVGGVIFFSRNYESPSQLAQLASDIKKLRPHLLLCVDQEGGRVQRFIKGMTRLPRLRALGERLESDPKQLPSLLIMAEKIGYLMALEVRSLGVDLSFAPVLDLDKGVSEIIGDRAFHYEPETVAKFASSYIKGMNKAGMRATGKHFPGHGSVALDSHLGLPIDPRSRDDIEADMLPFRLIVAEGLSAIMPAHIVYPEIDPYPVGFSSYWLQTVLRQQLAFDGAIVSDDLSMGGATGMGTYAERAVRAIDAGCDYLLVCNHREGAIETLEALKDTGDEMTQRRRASLLAIGKTPDWQSLTGSSEWQWAHGALNELFSYETHV
ncbi:MAG: beta-N-acetylhexosaminidase [Candidatus Berkiella sp.]